MTTTSTLTTAPVVTRTIVGDTHVMRTEDGEIALYQRSPEGLVPLGRYSSAAVAMNVLDLLDER